MTVVCRDGRRFDANHVGIFNRWDAGGAISEVAFQSSGTLVRIPADEIVGIEYLAAAGQHCSGCDGSIFDWLGVGIHDERTLRERFQDTTEALRDGIVDAFRNMLRLADDPKAAPDGLTTDDALTPRHAFGVATVPPIPTMQWGPIRIVPPVTGVTLSVGSLGDPTPVDPNVATASATLTPRVSSRPSTSWEHSTVDPTEQPAQ